MKRILVLLVGLFLAAQTTQAWVITPAWEYLVRDKANFPSSQTAAYLPILTNIWSGTSVMSNQMVGLDPYPLLGPLKRYDNNRMLLQIMENGIVESSQLQTTNFALYQLSTNFPDRSLIWINPTNGAPMGVALVIGQTPVVPARPDWASNFVAVNGTAILNVNEGYSPNWKSTAIKWDSVPPADSYPAFMHPTNAAFFNNCWYMDYDVSEDGFIYVGHRYKIFRYAPDGSGGFVTTPEVIFTVGVSTNSLGETNACAYNNDRFKHRWFDLAGQFTSIKVRGSGINTKITAGGRATWEIGNYGDRELWYIGAWKDTGGNTNWFPIWHQTKTSSPGTSGGPHTAMIPALTNYTGGPNEIWCYETEFPGNSGISTGPFCAAITNANPYGYTNGPDAYTQPITRLGFATTGPGFTANTTGYLGVNTAYYPYYRQQYIGGLECRVGVPFLVTCEVPSPSTTEQFTGYLGLHDLVTGTRLGVWDQKLNEADIILGTDTSMNYYGRFAELTISATNGLDQAAGTYEVTYGSYCFGYGRYLVKPDNIDITNIVTGGGSSTINFTAGNTSTNNDYVLQKAPLMPLDGKPAWTDVGTLIAPTGPYNTPGTPLVDSAATDPTAFYRVRLRVP